MSKGHQEEQASVGSEEARSVSPMSQPPAAKRPHEAAETGPSDDSIDSPETRNQHQKHNAKRPRLTAQDVQVARETAELFKSNIFKLEIDELVRELRLKPAHCQLMERVLHRLYEILQEIPNSDELSLKEAYTLFDEAGHAIPFPDPKPTAVNYKFAYETPEDVSLVGSFGLKTGIQQPKGKMAIDVSVTMPRTLFQHKDYMNYRAIYKRAFYLGYIANHLVQLSQKKHLPVRVSYEYADGDTLCPTLRIESVGPEGTPAPDELVFEKTGFVIRLYAGFPFGCFEAKKLLPDRNCIRVQTADSLDVSDLPPTPLYNASILTSSSYSVYNKYLYASKKTAEAFRDACVLGKLWLQQRGFASTFNEGGFGHFEFVTLMAALLDGGGEHGNKVLLHGFSSYQLFKATILYIAKMDLCQTGYLSFSSIIGEHKASYKSNGFGVPTVFDRNTKINILWKMTPSSYNLLRLYAQQTSELLNDVVFDRFPQTFIQKTRPSIQYDVTMLIPIDAIFQEGNFGPLEKISFITYERFVCSKIFKILSAALEPRVKQISVTLSVDRKSWSLMRRRPGTEDKRYVVVGLLLDSVESEKRITKGPLHSQKAEGEKFASFWGSKAQVRKYKDGNVQYSCLWPTSASESITVSISRYILDLHVTTGISSRIVVNSGKFSSYLPQPLTASAPNSHPLIMPSHFQQLKVSYDALCKVIYNSKTPLTVKSILPASAALRGTSLLLPTPFAVSNPDFFNDSVVQFETSTRWPDELFALEQTKTAFLLKVCNSLNTHNGYQAYMCKDESLPYMKHITTMCVLTPEGYGFRFKVLTERDETLYLRAIENAEPNQKQAVTDSYVKFMQNYVGSVKHHRAVGILVTRYPFFSASVRLFKRWLDSQLLYSHFAEELVEMIAVHAFLDPAPYFTPNSVETGFLRVINFLSQWNWIEDPLIVDLSSDSEDADQSYAGVNGRLTVPENQTMYSNFKKLRKEDPSGAKVQFFVASRADPSGKLWSTNRAGLPIASRLTSLSKAVVGLLSKPESISEHKLKLAFTPAIKDYNFAIELKAPVDLRAKSGVMPQDTYRNLIQPPTSFSDAIESQEDPLQKYYAELVARFSNVAVLSIHRYTGLNDSKDGKRNVITGLFNPTVVKGKKKFRPNAGYSTKPTDDETVECNEEAIVAQMVTLGGDLVTGFKAYH